MPISIVVGGQFGSEGKGKVAFEMARRNHTKIAIRVGGSNSGHTVVTPDGNIHVFRHVPTASLLPWTTSIIGPGSYIDLNVLRDEISNYSLSNARLLIDPNAVLITDQHKKVEINSGLIKRVGSTGSGTGAAILERISRTNEIKFAKDEPELSSYIKDTSTYLSKELQNGERIILEGTQGFGLSLIHSPYYPYVTSRDTTASGFLSEAGLSPLDVDQIVMVIRAFPIRVAGNSGPFPNEISWKQITLNSGALVDVQEHTTVTKKIRRVAKFDAEIVRQSILRNCPTDIVLNHLDYVDANCLRENKLSYLAKNFIKEIENSISMKINYIGINQKELIDMSKDIREKHVA